jgi:hypothetical protein
VFTLTDEFAHAQYDYTRERMLGHGHSRLSAGPRGRDDDILAAKPHRPDRGVAATGRHRRGGILAAVFRRQPRRLPRTASQA